MSPETPKIRRPMVRWFGGKWRLAPWVIAHLPAHSTYVEPFGGGGSVLMRKPPAPLEIFNDLDLEAVNLFRVLQDPKKAAKLKYLLRHTPFARAEYERSIEASTDAVERARRLMIRTHMGFTGSPATTRGAVVMKGFRSGGRRASEYARQWQGLVDQVDAYTARLGGVVIEQRPALQVLARYDWPDTLAYVDPPYVHETRRLDAQGRPEAAYQFEMSLDQHAELLAALLAFSGMVVLSGYGSALYDQALADWKRVERVARADGGNERTEVLWINPRCAQALEAR